MFSYKKVYLSESVLPYQLASMQHISISICGQTDGKITCEILNSNFPKNETDKSGSGIGLMQVARRLELSYPGRYEWDKGTSDDDRTYISTSTIQTTES